jgi:Tfp pilus assembly protein PilE
MRKGFSTIELVTTMSIVAILGTTMLPSYTAMQQEAKVTKASAEVKTLQNLVEKYQAATGSLPNSLSTMNLDQDTELINQEFIDPFTKVNYKFMQGRTETGKQYYIIYSDGLNGNPNFIREGNKLIVPDNEIIASNLYIVRK